ARYAGELGQLACLHAKDLPHESECLWRRRAELSEAACHRQLETHTIARSKVLLAASLALTRWHVRRELASVDGTREQHLRRLERSTTAADARSEERRVGKA